MNVTLRRTLMVCVLALLLAATWAGTASAAPQGSVDPDTLTPPPPPGAQCKDTGKYVICQTFGGGSFANEPESTLSCGTAYSTGSSHVEGIRWYSDGLLVKRFLTATEAGTLSLSPTGEGPTVKFVGHYSSVDYLATPGELVLDVPAKADARLCEALQS